jgi:hypothetical protein
MVYHAYIRACLCHTHTHVRHHMPGVHVSVCMQACMHVYITSLYLSTVKSRPQACYGIYIHTHTYYTHTYINNTHARARAHTHTHTHTHTTLIHTHTHTHTHSLSLSLTRTKEKRNIRLSTCLTPSGQILMCNALGVCLPASCQSQKCSRVLPARTDRQT